jgi:hypothetical protein
MGVLTDLVMADEQEANRIAESHYPLGEYPGIDIKGIDSVKLNVLHGILTSKTFEELLPQYDPIAEASEEGPWVFLLPHELVELLSLLDDVEVKEVAMKWGGTEEFQLAGWDQPAVIEVLKAIADLARRSVSEKKHLFAWMSL